MRDTSQRRETILQTIARQGLVQVTDLVDQPGVSAVTIRSDLSALEGLGLVRAGHQLAPEIDGHLDLIPHLAAPGIRVQLGHSAGTYEDGVAALAACRRIPPITSASPVGDASPRAPGPISSCSTRTCAPPRCTSRANRSPYKNHKPETT